METGVADDTRSRVLAAAGPVFADKGFQAATVREICAAAGVNLASVNYHFGDKQRLYFETVRQAHQERVERVPLPGWRAGTDVATKLHGFIRTLVGRMVGVQEAPWQTRLMLREILHPTSACKELVQDYFRPHFVVLLSILDEMLPPDTPPHRRHQIGFSIIGQCLFYRVADEVVSLMLEPEEFSTRYGVDQLAEHIADFSIAALTGAETLSQDGSSLTGHRPRQADGTN